MNEHFTLSSGLFVFFEVDRFTSSLSFQGTLSRPEGAHCTFVSLEDSDGNEVIVVMKNL